MASKKEAKRGKLTFIESDDSPSSVRKAFPDKELMEFDIFVRKPDNVDSGDFAVAARLCSCRRVCLAFIDPD